MGQSGIEWRSEYLLIFGQRLLRVIFSGSFDTSLKPHRDGNKKRSLTRSLCVTAASSTYACVSLGPAPFPEQERHSPILSSRCIYYIHEYPLSSVAYLPRILTSHQLRSLQSCSHFSCPHFSCPQTPHAPLPIALFLPSTVDRTCCLLEFDLRT